MGHKTVHNDSFHSFFVFLTGHNENVGMRLNNRLLVDDLPGMVLDTHLHFFQFTNTN